MLHLNVPKLSSFPRKAKLAPQSRSNLTENSVHTRLPAVEACSWIPATTWTYGFLVWTQLAGHFKPPTNFGGVSLLHPTQDPQTTPVGLFGLDQIKHGSWVQTWM
jgi:hypothetical protein